MKVELVGGERDGAMYSVGSDQPDEIRFDKGAVVYKKDGTNKHKYRLVKK